MRYFFLFLSLWALTLDAESQIWFEGDPFWHFRLDYSHCNQERYGDASAWVDRDTLIDGLGMIVLKVVGETGGMTGPATINREHIYYEQGEQVFLYLYDSLHLLYDFSVNIGDTISYPVFENDLDCDSTVFIRLDTIEQILIEDDVRRLQRWRIVNQDGWFEGEYAILEGISLAFSPINYFCTIHGPCNPFIRDCYFYGDGLWSYPISKDCSFLLSDEEVHLPSASVSILPNPTTGSFRIELNLPIEQISVYSNMGQLIFTGPEQALNLTGKPVGVYWVSLLFENGQQSIQKVILQE